MVQSILLLSLINATTIVFHSYKGNCGNIFKLFFFILLPTPNCLTKLHFSFLCKTINQLPVWFQPLGLMRLYGPLSLAHIPLSAFKRKLSVSPTKVFRVFWGSCTSATHSGPYLPLLVNFQSSSQLTFVAVQPMDPKKIPEWDMIFSLFYFTPNISHPTKPYRTNLTEDFSSNDKGPMWL